MVEKNTAEEFACGQFYVYISLSICPGKGLVKLEFLRKIFAKSEVIITEAGLCQVRKIF